MRRRPAGPRAGAKTAETAAPAQRQRRPPRPGATARKTGPRGACAIPIRGPDPAPAPRARRERSRVFARFFRRRPRRAARQTPAAPAPPRRPLRRASCPRFAGGRSRGGRPRGVRADSARGRTPGAPGAGAFCRALPRSLDGVDDPSR